MAAIVKTSRMPVRYSPMRTPWVLLLLVVSACTAGPDRRAYLSTLVGQPEAEVVRQLGVPTRVYETGGHKFLAYVERRERVYGGPVFGGFGYFGAGYGFYDGFPAEVTVRTCETTFEVADARVLTWALRGNACG